MAAGDGIVGGGLLAQGALPTDSAFATIDTMQDASTVKGTIPVLDYIGATEDTHAEWNFFMPPNYDGGGLVFEPNYAMDGTVGTAVQFEIRVIQQVASDVITSQDLQAQTPTDITDTPNGSANVHDVAPTGTVSHVNCGSPSAGDFMRARISRDYDHAANGDTLQFIGTPVTEGA